MEPFFRPPAPPYSPYAPTRTRRPRRTRDAPADRASEIGRIAKQLQKVAETLTWGRVQNDAWDHLCPFIFELRTADAVAARLEEVARANPRVDPVELKRYVMRRWYCFWGARLAELLFLRHPNVEPGRPKDHEVDFYLDGDPFDLKTTELPRAFTGGLAEVLADPSRAIIWFYAHQSRERRFHVRNRLFLLLADPNDPGQAWRLRGDRAALEAAIDPFVAAPAYVEVSVADTHGIPHVVRSAILPVLPLGASRQLPMSLPASSRRSRVEPDPIPEQPRLF
jgi:hypothetical protein